MKTRLFRIVVIAPDGREEVVEPALTQPRAEAYVESYNHVLPPHGHRAVAREIHLPSIRLLADVRRERRKRTRRPLAV